MPIGDGVPPPAEVMPVDAPAFVPPANALMPPTGAELIAAKPPLPPGAAEFDELQLTASGAPKRSSIAHLRRFPLELTVARLGPHLGEGRVGLASARVLVTAMDFLEELNRVELWS